MLPVLFKDNGKRSDTLGIYDVTRSSLKSTIRSLTELYFFCSELFCFLPSLVQHCYIIAVLIDPESVRNHGHLFMTFSKY